ncbi:hypothetical protein DTO164E3_1567 [Paecilomyces variotii]|nr:hypothetical protein DTO032I3_3364 [Paecilomyces variotii]KAJ9204944.1 hypothetical protein DTO164E3_1567 [Paecilomyces variotii]KAJ9225623.1 hypothetical protein DTO169C6_2059 [Paecilomyces variotii]KAJ9277337.1 hypothetical protein DTO021D3_5802 [Paecilomyces variotii]KAJ9343433.1 hypothetical protein DTO027B6_4010 [Paecilomyces variotii]
MSTPNPRGRRSPPGSGTPGQETGRRAAASPAFADISRLPTTPGRFTGLATPSANRSATRRTPRTGAPSTPFGLRAIQRRAANTPGRDRRKSGRPQRETPFDILRNLGRALAPVSALIRSSPQEEPEPPKKDEIDELDNEPEIPKPRLSLPIEMDEEDEDGPDIPPPRLSLAFEEEDITQASIEYPRRAMAEADRARLERMSFGDVRLSENFGDLSRLENLDDLSDAGDYTGLQQDEAEERGDVTGISAGFDAGGETDDLGRFNFDFNFPSPNAAAATGPDLAQDDDDGFMLDTADMQHEPELQPLSERGDNDDEDDDDVTGGFGMEVYMGDQASEAGSTQQAPIGGGLRDEPLRQGRKEKKISRHGHPVPNLPAAMVKKLATRFARTSAGAKTKLSKETLAAIEQASEWYFEQASDDLAAYAKHAGRKTIDEGDVMTLMRRQRHTNNATTVFSLAQKHLPKELLQDMRLAMPP